VKNLAILQSRWTNSQECEIALGTETVRLSVRASNHTAIRLYENTGYQVIDRWERYYTGGEDALVLEKRR